eukprot:GFYU01003335.1.p1 GENE.GFYU01003335.1~~GFYU01003335.1.p1  ORF type:complete len:447 (-),score=107.34 GFYU01003335.1:222-1562(-)
MSSNAASTSASSGSGLLSPRTERARMPPLVLHKETTCTKISHRNGKRHLVQATLDVDNPHVNAPMLTWKKDAMVSVSKRGEINIGDLIDVIAFNDDNDSRYSHPPECDHAKTITIVTAYRIVSFEFETTDIADEWFEAIDSVQRDLLSALSTITSADGQYQYWFGAFTEKGSYGDGSVRDNEDAFIVEKKFAGDPSCVLFGVFDGHGRDGQAASLFVRDTLPKELASRKKLKTSPASSIMKTFDIVEKRLAIHSRIRIESSGTTATVVFVNGRQLILGNVGDSRAVLARYDVRTDRAYAMDMSRDHRLSPSLPHFQKEKARIEAHGGIVKQHALDLSTRRVFFNDGTGPGLAMSRSLGDTMAKSCGVTHEPFVYETTLEDDLMFIVMASDGVWEFMTSQEVVDLVSEFDDPHEAAEALVLESAKRYEKEMQRTDDTTALVIFFKFS